MLILYSKEVVETKAYTAQLETGPSLQLEPSWPQATAMIGDIDFLPSLSAFDKDTINEETVELLHPYLSAPDFTPGAYLASSSVKSLALAGLIKWACGMALYIDTAEIVKPMVDELKMVEGKRKLSSGRQAKAQAELDGLTEALERKQYEYHMALGHKRSFRSSFRRTGGRINISRGGNTADRGGNHKV